ncbi:hypothetical protein SITYG_13810 [Streptococcus intermedius]|uniref:Uncharacterized protein n=1 Tax=Streptococcus intermedius TaxID=1338 RepID=A0AAD1C8L2_STRIT|nr:hypothetical protein SITYG_13810 [Streptococcus intermedius]
MGKIIHFSHISILSNNKLHYKVCLPNFYRFKFKFYPLAQLHKTLLLVSTNHKFSANRHFITFLICYYFRGF